MKFQIVLQKPHAMRLVAFLLPLLFQIIFSRTLYSANSDFQELFDKAESEGNIERLIDAIEELKKNPISLNDAKAEELRQLPWLNASDINAILLYRREKGRFLSIEELEPIIGREKTASVAPFVIIQKVSPSRKPSKGERSGGTFYSRYFRETTERAGILSGAYGGEGYKLYNRLQLSLPYVNASIVQEKDIGEADFFDHTSLGINVHDAGILKNAVFGNYTLNVAQGLLIGHGRYFSKGADPAGSVRLPSKLLQPFTSSSEYGFFQGGAATLKLDPLEVTQFYSVNRVDAIINSSGLLSSFNEAGYHRTLLEVSRKDNVTETVAGANLRYHFQTGNFRGHTGGTLLYYSYSEPLAALDPDGAGTLRSSATLYSVETDVALGNISFFGEAALSEQPADASWMAGVEYELLSGVNSVAAFRRYGEHYFSPFAGAFAERGSGASNEKGYYFGMNAELGKRFTLGASYDLFTFPSLSGDSSYPFASTGHDVRGFVTWKALRPVTMNLQLQQKYKEEARLQTPAGGSAIWTALPVETRRVRLDCDIKLSPRLKLRSRGEVKRVVNRFFAGDETFDGWLVYQQLHLETGRLAIKGRLTLFNTEDYDAAIYAAEDDLPLTSSLGVYDGRGKSFYLIALLQVMKQMKLGARFEKSWYSDRTVYSSGNDLRATSAPGSIHLGCLLTF